MDSQDRQPEDTRIFRSCFIILVITILLGVAMIFTWILSNALQINFWFILPFIGAVLLYVGINEAYKWIRRNGPSFEIATGDNDDN